MENFTEVKLEIFVPQEYVLQIRDELAKIGVGRIGNYDHCVAIYPVQGYYRPLEGANPFEGKIGEISEGVEYKIEVNCKHELVNKAIKVIKKLPIFKPGKQNGKTVNVYYIVPVIFSFK